MSEKIIITVGLDGSTVVKPEGFKGKSCKSATEGIERALGKVVASKTTSEYAQATPIQQQAKAGK